MKSQQQMILDALQQGEALSKIEILQRFGIFNSGARVLELRQQGHDIRTGWRRSKRTKKRFGYYYLIAPGVRREF